MACHPEIIRDRYPTGNRPRHHSDRGSPYNHLSGRTTRLITFSRDAPVAETSVFILWKSIYLIVQFLPARLRAQLALSKLEMVEMPGEALNHQQPVKKTWQEASSSQEDVAKEMQALQAH